MWYPQCKAGSSLTACWWAVLIVHLCSNTKLGVYKQKYFTWVHLWNLHNTRHHWNNYSWPSALNKPKKTKCDKNKENQGQWLHVYKTGSFLTRLPTTADSRRNNFESIETFIIWNGTNGKLQRHADNKENDKATQLSKKLYQCQQNHSRYLWISWYPGISNLHFPAAQSEQTDAENARSAAECSWATRGARALSWHRLNSQSKFSCTRLTIVQPQTLHLLQQTFQHLALSSARCLPYHPILCSFSPISFPFGPRQLLHTANHTQCLHFQFLSISHPSAMSSWSLCLFRGLRTETLEPSTRLRCGQCHVLKEAGWNKRQ